MGGHVVEYLFQQGEISKGTFRKGAHLRVMDQNGVQGIEADLLDHHSLHEAVEGTDTIFSMASPVPWRGSDFMRVNTEGIMNLLEVSVEMKVKAFVHLSTLDVYGFGAGEVSPSSTMSPAGEYQKAKSEAERVLMEFSKRNSQPRVVIIRPARAVGSGDPSLTLPILRMLETGKVVLPSSKLMSWSHPRDIGQAMLKAATNPSLGGKSYLVKSFDATAETLARAFLDASGSKAEVRGEGLLSRSAVPPYVSEQLKASLRISGDAELSELGYKPEWDLKKTAEDVASWYKKEPWVTEPA